MSVSSSPRTRPTWFAFAAGLALLVAIAVVACSDQTPTSPTTEFPQSFDAAGATAGSEGGPPGQGRGRGGGGGGNDDGAGAGDPDDDDPDAGGPPDEGGDDPYGDEEDQGGGRGGGRGGGQPKVDICHITGNGSYNLLNIAQPAVPAHLGHGDNFPFTEVPTQPGLVFDAACVPSTISIDIEKSTNGEDADAPPGPEIIAGTPVNWTYTVTNTGQIDLVDVTVSDDQAVAVSCPENALAAGDSMVCTAGAVAVGGPYANVGTASGESTGGFGVNDSDPSHYTGRVLVPSIDIEKATNGVDADTPEEGETLLVGDPVTWTYVVTNDGEVPLTDVTVADSDPEVDLICPQTTLAVGESMICSASGTVANGPYANVGSVTSLGEDPDDPVTDSDPSHYTGRPRVQEIDIEKATNGIDADTPSEGETLLLGDPVAWTYVVTNEGEVTLTDVTVTDDQGVAVSCPQTTLAVGESMTCTANGTVVPGPYANVGSVTSFGTDPNVPITDSDPSHYTGSAAALDIEKATNDVDADTPALGPGLLQGAPVTWTYVVTNIGEFPLTDVTVTDSDPAVTPSCPTDTLDPGQSMTCTASGVAIDGPYSNAGTATGVSNDPDDPVSATDLSHYTGARAVIELQKSTNGLDADTGSGPEVQVGDALVLSYVVSNNGSVQLSGVVITDTDPTASNSCPATTLAPGASMTCPGSATAAAGAQSFTGTASGSFAGTTVSDDDPSNYTGIDFTDLDVAIVIEKSTNLQDADTSGPTLTVGTPVTWRYVVTNTGQVAFTSVTVTDDQGVVPVCPPEIVGLAPGQSMTCTATGTVVVGPYTNVGTATGTTAQNATATATDPSNYTGVAASAPGVSIEKTTNNADADGPLDPDVPEIFVGTPIVWRYIVTNTGNTLLSPVTVTDDQGVAVSCPQAFLQIGQSMTCLGYGNATPGDYANVGTVVGTPPSGPDVTASDPSHYRGVGPDASIAIEKSTCNAAGSCQDADTPPGITLSVPGTVTWKYLVTNTSGAGVDLSGVTVTDSHNDVTVDCTGMPDPLTPGQSFTCTASGPVAGGQYSNLGTATGTHAPSGLVVSASDPSHYNAPLPTGASILIEKSTNGVDADTGPGPSIVKGNEVAWRYVITNTGDVPLFNWTVTDDKLGAICSAFSGAILAPGASETCLRTGVAVIGAYANTGTVTAFTGLPAPNDTVTDSDDSHYTGVPIVGINIEKSTCNPAIQTAVICSDADAAPGLSLNQNQAVRWQYLVTNTGEADLINVTVTDDQGVTVDCNGQTTLAAGTEMLCIGLGTAQAGQYRNVGTATGITVDNRTASDSDPSHYFGEFTPSPEPSLTIVKRINGLDVAPGQGPFLNLGDPILWTYTVVNTGNVELFVDVSDNVEGAAACPNQFVLPGVSITCSINSSAVLGAYANTGTASGRLVQVDFSGNKFPIGSAVATAQDSSGYTGIEPGQAAIDIEKLVNGVDADTTPGPSITVGNAVAFTFIVTNTGNQPLANVVVSDTVFEGISCPSTSLAVGQSMTCTFDTTAVAGAHTNVATVRADPTVPDASGRNSTVTDSDAANYTGVSVDDEGEGPGEE